MSLKTHSVIWHIILKELLINMSNALMLIFILADVFVWEVCQPIQ